MKVYLVAAKGQGKVYHVLASGQCPGDAVVAVRQAAQHRGIKLTSAKALRQIPQLRWRHPEQLILGL